MALEKEIPFGNYHVEVLCYTLDFVNILNAKKMKVDGSDDVLFQFCDLFRFYVDFRGFFPHLHEVKQLFDVASQAPS